MISNIIVYSTVFLALVFTALYLLRPGLRKKVEQPRYTFLQQLSMYDKQNAVANSKEKNSQNLDVRKDSTL
jgi:hypothetical protein